MEGMVAGADISFFVVIAIYGPYYTYDILKMYWQRMERMAVKTIAPGMMEKISLLMYH